MRTISRFRFTAVLAAVLAAAGALALAPAAGAADLDGARRAGQIGELPNGYVQAMPGTSADIRALADTVNAQRRAEYSRIAGERGTTADAVGAVTAGVIAGKVPPGTPIMGSDGKWKTR